MPFVRRARYTALLEKLRVQAKQIASLEKDLGDCVTNRDHVQRELMALLAFLARDMTHARLFMIGDEEGLKAWPTKGIH